MPRSPSGVYTLPVAAFVSGTIIKSADMNSDLSDIATALTQSLATTGVSAMTGPLVLSAGGTVTNPALSFTGFLTTGIYLAGPNSIGVTIAGLSACVFAADGSVMWNGANTFNAGILVTGSGLELATGTTLLLDSGASVTFNAISYTFSSAGANALIAAMAMNFNITWTIDGGGSVPATGTYGFYEVPCGCTVQRWTLTADQSGSAVLDVVKSTYAGFPPTASIAGTDIPTISAAQKAQSSALTGWTKNWLSGDIAGFKLNSITSITRLQISLLMARTTR